MQACKTGDPFMTTPGAGRWMGHSPRSLPICTAPRSPTCIVHPLTARHTLTCRRDVDSATLTGAQVLLPATACFLFTQQQTSSPYLAGHPHELLLGEQLLHGGAVGRVLRVREARQAA